jgi:hypothetical protein
LLRYGANAAVKVENPTGLYRNAPEVAKTIPKAAIQDNR